MGATSASGPETPPRTPYLGEPAQTMEIETGAATLYPESCDTKGPIACSLRHRRIAARHQFDCHTRAMGTPPMPHRYTRPSRPQVLMALGYYDPQLHHGIVRFAREAGWVLDASMAHYGIVPHHWQGDGILTILVPGRSDITQYVVSRRARAVALYGDLPEIKIPRVVLDDVQIGRMAAEHLLERGFVDLAFYKFTDLAAVRNREAGFRETARRARRRYHLLDWDRASREEHETNWFEWLKSRLAELPLPAAIMAQSDHRASFLMSACEAVGLAIPEDVAVIGVDNQEYACELAKVPLSSVDCDREHMAYEGARLLDALMRGQRPPKRPVVIPPKQTVVRQSSDIFAVRDRTVAKALSFIRDHYREPIGVEDVVAASRTNRCQLYRAFERHLHRSIGSEIDRQRVEHAKQMLVETKEKLYRVARLCGFSGPEHFSRVFLRVTGVAPSHYRTAQRKTQTMQSSAARKASPGEPLPS